MAENKLKRGDKDDAGRVFWQYGRNGAESWCRNEIEFGDKKEKTKHRLQQYRSTPGRKARDRELFQAWKTRTRWTRSKRIKRRVESGPKAGPLDRRKDGGHKRTRCMDPEQRARLYRSQTDYQKKRRAYDTEYLVVRRLRVRISNAVRGSLVGRKPTRAEDRDAVMFLCWLAHLRGIRHERLRSFHLDHVIPLARWKEVAVEYQPNSPENVRWLQSGENLKKSDSIPSQDEIRVHIQLVHQWRESVDSLTEDL